ncbi:MAG TPA: molecular chaperone TorD family protein, partial [Actinomycetota bacterium]|nr:molecular chaperone TorD family protein [Actinomycetota bacterium]
MTADRAAVETSAAELRRTVYRVLAGLFLFPDRERLATLATAAPEVRRRTEPLRDLAFFPSWDALVGKLEGLSDGDVERLQEEYTALFVSGAHGRSCPPYESAYAGGPGLESGLIGADIEAVYASVGMGVVATGELPDHLAVELEFLSFLCGEEAGSADPSDGDAWRARQHAFLSKHLLRWLPTFVSGLRAVDPGGFYRGAAEAALEFAGHDKVLVEALAGTHPEAV